MQTRRYPRTLEEAFGPHTSRHIDEDTISYPTLRWALISLAAVVCVAIASGALL